MFQQQASAQDENRAVMTCSWESILKNKLLNHESVSRAAIHSIDGTCYACSPDFAVHSSEIKNLKNGITEDPSVFYSGISIAGEQYKYRGCEPGFSLLCNLKRTGIIVIRTRKLIVIGEYTNDSLSGHCYTALERLAEQLRVHEF